jgi:hypothetical protein
METSKSVTKPLLNLDLIYTFSFTFCNFFFSSMLNFQSSLNALFFASVQSFYYLRNTYNIQILFTPSLRFDIYSLIACRSILLGSAHSFQSFTARDKFFGFWLNSILFLSFRLFSFVLLPYPIEFIDFSCSSVIFAILPDLAGNDALDSLFHIFCWIKPIKNNNQ